MLNNKYNIIVTNNKSINYYIFPKDPFLKDSFVEVYTKSEKPLLSQEPLSAFSFF
jgi:hypothetical protein